MKIPSPPNLGSLFGKTRLSAFSLPEVLVVVCLLALLTSIVLPSFSGQKTAVARAKLHSDVNVLNHAVKLYVAEGGQLPANATSDDVLARLKTRSGAEFARRHVGTVTGRFIDPRLAARPLSASQVSTNTPRAVWNSAQQEFVIATAGSGIGSFYFDDAKLDLARTEEDRLRSAMLFNRADGWIWEWGGNPELAAVSPDSFVTYASGSGGPPASGGSGSPSTSPSTAFVPKPPLTLPTPTILPIGGGFSPPRFPSSIFIFPNGASTDYSVLQYRIDDGVWKPYTAAFSVTSGAKVYARNVTLDKSRYLDSPEDMETYIMLTHFFTGTITPQWANMLGKDNLQQNIDNTILDDIKATYGTPAGSNASTNLLGFKRAPFISVAADTDFRVGEIRYVNGTVASGTEATSIDLKLNIQIVSPTLAAGSAAAHLSLWSSTNNSSQSGSADYAQLDNPKTDFTFQVEGVTYVLELRFANVKAEEGWTDGTKLYVYENSTGHADLIARFKSQ